ncbi:predicted protein [Naegleria gruberi]|uniref:Predicted protein n=1 Tax=Naegleria gruberi TaxID=5762 RepID=D2VBJ4_NAEGR|nr:uncharacterized protein NAEGRDRAFT_66238 [Naegleria gruberi]EFC45809.1 predicted protein [Naegleria gruberi]|eukprot:XP_002678553.1 predicted protein [Naegleria gruberi strain NEG-M]
MSDDEPVTYDSSQSSTISFNFENIKIENIKSEKKTTADVIEMGLDSENAIDIDEEDDVIFVTSSRGRIKQENDLFITSELELKSVRVKRAGIEKSCFIRFYFRDCKYFKHSRSAISYFVPCDQKFQIFIYSQLLKNNYLDSGSSSSKSESPIIDWNNEAFEIIPMFMYPKRMIPLCPKCFEEYKKGQSTLMFDHILSTYHGGGGASTSSEQVENIGVKVEVKKENASVGKNSREVQLKPPHDLIDRLIYNRRRLQRILEHHWSIPKPRNNENSTRVIRMISYIERLYLYFKHLIAEKEFSKADTIGNSILLIMATHGQYFSKKISGHYPLLWMEREELLITHTKVAMANAFLKGTTAMLEKSHINKTGVKAYMNTKMFSDQIHLTSLLQVSFFLFRMTKKEKGLFLLNKFTLSWVFSSFCRGYYDILVTRQTGGYNAVDLSALENLLFRLPGFIHNHDFLDFLSECAFKQNKKPLVKDYHARFYENAPNDIYAKVKYMKILMSLCKEEKHLIVSLALEILQVDPLSTIAEKVLNIYAFENSVTSLKVKLNAGQVLSLMKSLWKYIESDFELDSPWRVLSKTIIYATKSLTPEETVALIKEFREFSQPTFDLFEIGDVLYAYLLKRMENASPKVSEKKKDQNILLAMHLIYHNNTEVVGDFSNEKLMESLKNSIWQKAQNLITAANVIVERLK